MTTTDDTCSRKEGGSSWLVVLGVSVIQLTISPIVHCFGLIYEHEFQNLGMSTVELSLLIHINSVVGSVLGLLCAPALHYFDFRFVAIVGCLLCCFATCLMSFADSWLSFMFTYSFLYGMGQGILYPTTTLAISTHFKKLRSLAVGLSVSASSFGPVLSPSLVTYLFYLYGTFGTVLILGAFAFNSIAGALLLRPLPPGNKGNKASITKDEDHNEESSAITISDNCRSEYSDSNSEYYTRPDKVTLTDDNENEGSSCSEICKTISNAFDLDLFKDPTYLNIAMGMAISIASEYNFCMMLPFILVDIAKLDKHTLAIVISVQAGADIIARTLIPFIANWLKINVRLGFVGSLLGSILGRIILAHFYDYYEVILLQAVIIGTFKGFKAVFQSLVIPDYVPLTKLAAASGLYMILNGIMSLICGLIIGFIRDSCDDYILALYGTSVLSSLCIISWSIEYFVKRYKIKSSNFISKTA